nr:EAL domain-containing response regulator [uncultured Brevundimonas sp.]
MFNAGDDIAFSTALVVDDDPIMCEVAKSTLRVLGLQNVDVATSGLDALAKIQDKVPAFDLIVSDLQMPEMDGISFFRALGERRHTGALVVLSSMNDDILQLAERLADSHGLDVLGVLSKPLDKGRLHELLCKPSRQAAALPSQPEGRWEPDLVELRNAILANEFHPHYQSKINIANGLVTGAEALARWHHPDRGLLAAADFIEPAERLGLISDVSWSVMHAALTDSRKLLNKNADFKVAVNLSADQISDRQLPERVQGLLDDYGVRPANLLLEVTESKLLEQSVDAMEVFGRLRLLGVGLSIDDFGTGQANLKTLRAFPFTEMKIDRSFIASAPTDARARASVAACVSLGRDLGMRIVAEGIETEQQLQMASDFGIDEAQGFFFSRPVPISSFTG